MSAPIPDPSLFADWIGRATERRDILTARLSAEFEATLAPYLADVRGARPGLFWTLAPDTERPEVLGRDGHPRLGVYLPPLPFERRMWAGGELVFEGDFHIGDEVEKTSVIENIAFKAGGTGLLGFVTVRHAYAVAGRRILDERQDIVYRGAPAPGATAAALRAPTPEGEVVGAWTVEATPTLLFRYSAMTFNGHRIHYDQPYARDVEGYAGLVVHGPMQATLMLNLAAATLGRLPRRFAYRGLSPLICGRPFQVEAIRSAEGNFTTRVSSADGVATMSGLAEAG